MKVAIIADNYYPQVNGVVERIGNYRKYWIKKGHIVDIYSITDHENVHKCNYLPIAEWFGYDKPGEKIPSFGMMYMTPKQINEFRYQEYDIVWVAMASIVFQFLSCYLSTIGTKTKIFVSYHTDLIVLNDKYIRNKFFSLYLLYYGDN